MARQIRRSCSLLAFAVDVSRVGLHLSFQLDKRYGALEGYCEASSLCIGELDARLVSRSVNCVVIERYLDVLVVLSQICLTSLRSVSSCAVDNIFEGCLVAECILQVVIPENTCVVLQQNELVFAYIGLLSCRDLVCGDFRHTRYVDVSDDRSRGLVLVHVDSLDYVVCRLLQIASERDLDELCIGVDTRSRNKFDCGGDTRSRSTVLGDGDRVLASLKRGVLRVGLHVVVDRCLESIVQCDVFSYVYVPRSGIAVGDCILPVQFCSLDRLGVGVVTNNRDLLRSLANFQRLVVGRDAVGEQFRRNRLTDQIRRRRLDGGSRGAYSIVGFVGLRSNRSGLRRLFDRDLRSILPHVAQFMIFIRLRIVIYVEVLHEGNGLRRIVLELRCINLARRGIKAAVLLLLGNDELRRDVATCGVVGSDECRRVVDTLRAFAAFSGSNLDIQCDSQRLICRFAVLVVGRGTYLELTGLGICRVLYEFSRESGSTGNLFGYDADVLIGDLLDQ